MRTEAQREAERQYREKHRIEINERRKKYHLLNREKELKYGKNYYQLNKEKVVEQNGKWQKNHRSIVNATRLKYYTTQNGLAHTKQYNYSAMDRRHNMDTSNNLDYQWIMDNIFTSSCVYCGKTDWHLLGYDRIDNSKPHTPDNVVCACGKCNLDRQRKHMSVEDYIKYKKAGS